MKNEIFIEINGGLFKDNTYKNEGKFEELARPMIKYLCENYHPHVTVIITPTSAELLSGLKTVGYIDDYIVD